MAQPPDSPYSSQPFLPPPAPPGPRGLPRPTPIGALVGVVALLLCLASVALAALLTNTLGIGRTTTPTPQATAVAQQLPGTGTTGTVASPARTAVAGSPTVAALTTEAPSGSPTAVIPPPLNPAAPPPQQTIIAELPTPGAPVPQQTVIGGLPPATAPPAGPPTDTPVLATPVFAEPERAYLAAFDDQAKTWQGLMIALNVEIGSVDPSQQPWLDAVNTTTGQVISLTQQIQDMQAPPRLAPIDARYKAGAQHMAQAMRLFLQWVAGRSPAVLQQFNTEMRTGNDGLQVSLAAITAFEANPDAPIALPPEEAAPPTEGVPPSKPPVAATNPPAAATSAPVPTNTLAPPPATATSPPALPTAVPTSAPSGPVTKPVPTKGAPSVATPTAPGSNNSSS